VSLDYKGAGVDLDAAERTKDSLKALVESTRDANTLSEMGLFGGLYAVPEDVSSPVLVSSADGVGTKLKVAFMAGIHDTVGQDLVNHCVDDILVLGARPLFFLDYLATGQMDEGVVSDVVRGVAIACKENGCSLLGGETAQMPEFYAADEYDLAGFIVGISERDAVLDGSRVQVGDTLIGMGSSGLHTNGYTLARKIVFEVMNLGVDDPFPETGGTVAEALLAVHRSYLHGVMPSVQDGTIRALAHITGGGIPGNLLRCLGDHGASIDLNSWEVPPVFQVMEEAASVARTEMLRVFNMGVGMIAACADSEVEGLLKALSGRGEDAWVIGEVTDSGSVTFD
jgi:phosphoribosylformylglycinamidine cyclo-ligase